MANLQEVFNNCKILYNKAYTCVCNMSKTIAELMRKEGKQFDPQIAPLKFDIILQYSLMQVAVSDNDFHQNEMVFIRDLTQQGDFVNYINTIAKTHLTWEGLLNSNVKDIRDVLNSLLPLMRDLSNEFVTVYSICDKATDYNYLDDLKQSVLAIILGLSVMDFDASSENLDTYVLMVEVMNRIEANKRG